MNKPASAASRNLRRLSTSIVCPACGKEVGRLEYWDHVYKKHGVKRKKLSKFASPFEKVTNRKREALRNPPKFLTDADYEELKKRQQKVHEPGRCRTCGCPAIAGDDYCTMHS